MANITSTPVPIYDPAVSVVLFKTIGRTLLNNTTPVSQRYQGAAATIDLTPFLSEFGQVQTEKNRSAPAGGFTITVADRPSQSGPAPAVSFETLYGLIEPMDYIVIRMRHDPPDGSTTQLPILMRGFVSNISRSEQMDQQGHPYRMVTIAGQDYGKLWQMLQIIYFPGFVVGQDILSSFKLFERFGVGFVTSQPVQAFVSQVVNMILNPYLAGLMPKNSPNPATIKLAVSVQHGTVGITGPQNQEGSVYDLLRTYTDTGIWNELYIEDREDGVYCVFRPAPTLEIDGQTLIQSDATMPPIMEVDDTDIVTLSVERTDANVANFYWVRCPTFDLNSDIYRQMYAIGGNNRENVILDTYPNTSVTLYGVRAMYAETQLGADNVTTANSGQTASEQVARDGDMISWLDDRRRILVEQNKDNVLLESGVAVIRGRPDIHSGNYVRITRGGMSALYYVGSVSHNYRPFGLFTTVLQLERGLGFVERVKRGDGAASPYLVEELGDLGE